MHFEIKGTQREKSLQCAEVKTELKITPEWHPLSHSEGSDTQKLEADLAEMWDIRTANVLIADKEKLKHKLHTLQKTAKVIKEKQVYKFSFGNTVTITKTPDALIH